MQHKKEVLLFLKERNASNKNDQNVVYLKLCLLSLSYEMICLHRLHCVYLTSGCGMPAETSLCVSDLWLEYACRACAVCIWPLTSDWPADSALCMIRIAHAGFLPDTKRCPMVTSKSVIRQCQIVNLGLSALPCGGGRGWGETDYIVLECAPKFILT